MRASILAIAAALTLAVLPAAPAGRRHFRLRDTADNRRFRRQVPLANRRRVLHLPGNVDQRGLGFQCCFYAGESQVFTPLCCGAGGSAKSKLTAAGRKLMAGRKRRRVWLNVTVTLPDGGNALVSSRITLRR